MLDRIDAELLSSKVATLATLSPKGAPHLTAVWFLIDGDHVLISVNGKRQKVKNVTADARCSVLIYHPDTINNFVEIRGTATLIADNDFRIADRIATRYSADFRSFDQPGDSRFIIDVLAARTIVTDVRH
jgi:PPOX class probable F420-dependent enzyme